MKFIKINFPDYIFDDPVGKRNSMYEDPKPNEVIKAQGMFLEPVFPENEKDGTES